MTVVEAIAQANMLLPGVPAPDGAQDPRWQAIIAIGEFIESDPEDIWQFVAQWGAHDQADLRNAVATCLLEHLLEHHFSLVFPRAAALAEHNRNFAETLMMCWKFGQAETAENARRFDALRARLGRGPAA